MPTKNNLNAFLNLKEEWGYASLNRNSKIFHLKSGFKENMVTEFSISELVAMIQERNSDFNLSAFENQLQSNIPLSFEMKLNRQQNHPVIFKVTLKPNGSGDSSIFEGSFFDVTKYCNEIQGINDLIEVCAKVSRSIIYDYNFLTGHVYRTKGFYEILGYSPGEIENTAEAWVQLIHPEERQTMQNKVNNIPIGKSSYEFEYRVLHKDGHYVRILDRAVVIRDSNGIVQMRGCSEDISQQHTIMETIKKSRDSAEAASKTKSNFLANMSHELRTPLTAIIGYIELLGVDSIQESTKIKYMESVLRNAKHLNELIGEILDISKVESGQIDIKIEKINVEHFLTEIKNMFKVQVERKKLLFSIEEFNLPSEIYSDYLRVRQIFSNLIGNAIKFTRKGTVSVKLSYDEDELLIKAIITDTGIGIPKQEHKKVFEPFHQSDFSDTKEFGGTGLGLPIAKKLIEMLGGSIKIIWSTPDKGTQILVTLPNVETNLLTYNDADTKVAIVKHNVKDLNILIADDNPDNLALMKDILESKAANVVCAENGLKAVAESATTKYDLVVLDLQMPVMDGYEACRKITQMNHKIPVIAVTGHASMEIKKNCLHQGFAEFLPKPFTADQFLEAVDRTMHPYS